MKTRFLFLIAVLTAVWPTVAQQLAVKDIGIVTATGKLNAPPGSISLSDPAIVPGTSAFVRNYTQEASTSIDSLIAGLTATGSGGASEAVYSTYNTTTGTYVRNTSAWFAPYASALTCASAYTNEGWQVTAVTPIGFITAAHITGPGFLQVGAIVTFVDANNITYQRTIATLQTVSGDLAAGTFNTALPSSIVPAQILPYPLTSTFVDVPVFYEDQTNTGYVADITAVGAAYTLGLPPQNTEAQRYAFSKAATGGGNPAVSGDSSRPYGLFLGGRFTLLGTFFNTTGSGPDPGQNLAALQTAVTNAYPLSIANLPASGVQGITAGSGVTVAATTGVPNNVTISATGGGGGSSLNGVTVSNTPTVYGQVLTATTSSTAAWQSVAASLGLTTINSNTRTANYTASYGEMVLADCSAGSFTITLPAYTSGSRNIGVYIVGANEAAGYSVTVVPASTTMATGVATNLKALGEGQVYEYQIYWYSVAQIGSRASNDARYATTAQGAEADAAAAAGYQTAAQVQGAINSSTGNVTQRYSPNTPSFANVPTAVGQVATVSALASGSNPPTAVWATPAASGGSVTSVGLTGSSVFAVTNSPITSTGNIGLAFAAAPANSFLANLTGSTAAPTATLVSSLTLPESQITGLATDLSNRLLTSAVGTTVAQNLVPTAVMTSTYSVNPGDLIRADISAGNISFPLPTAPPDGSRVALKIVNVNTIPGTYTASLTCGGSDVLNRTGGSTSIGLTALFSSITFQYSAATHVWVGTGTDNPASQFQPASQFITLSGATITPNITTHGLTIINVVVSANTTIAPPTGITLLDTDQLEVRLTEDSTGGHTITWASIYDFSTNTQPSNVPTGANQASAIGFDYWSSRSKFCIRTASGPFL